jgi:hypothetical protein
VTQNCQHQKTSPSRRNHRFLYRFYTTQRVVTATAEADQDAPWRPLGAIRDIWGNHLPAFRTGPLAVDDQGTVGEFLAKRLKEENRHVLHAAAVTICRRMAPEEEVNNPADIATKFGELSEQKDRS